MEISLSQTEQRDFYNKLSINHLRSRLGGLQKKK